jgi:glutathione-regulated potassium-efflux system ancillary protein KefC
LLTDTARQDLDGREGKLLQGNLLLALFVLLAASVILVPLAKRLGLGTTLGYLAAGVLIGPYGLRLVSDSDTVRAVAELGVVMMLFLIGLELQPSELWRLRNKVLGLGIPQIVLTAGVIAVIAGIGGVAWETALVIGMALALSSTAFAMQSIAQRDITKTDTGRASLVVLLVQDVAVVPILAIMPILAGMGAPDTILPVNIEDAVAAINNPVDWLTPLYTIAAFAAAILGSRFVVRPLLYLIARAGVHEVFTAFGLALVVGAALLTQWAGLSPALGAFLGGVLLADSEYRHELQSNLEPFKGLLLGLFFITVGTSISFSVFAEAPLAILAIVAGLVVIKFLVLFALASFSRMLMAERLLFAVLLSQAGEFAFVVLEVAESAGSLLPHDYQFLTVVVAMSMATTPFLLLAFDRLVAPRLHTRAAPPNPAETIDSRQKVVVLGYGRFGQIVTRLLRSQGFEMTLIDDDPAQIELMKRFGIKVFYGDGSRLDLLRAADVDHAQMVVVAVAGRERILSIAATVRQHFPHVKIASRALDRNHAHELMALGVDVFERETFRSALALGVKALVSLGYTPEQAERLADAFAAHDVRLLTESYDLRHDEDAYIGFVRKSIEMLGSVIEADVKSISEDKPVNDDDADAGHIDNAPAARSS